MGLHISKTASLAPISAASSIIGFLSFAVTVATFLRVFWANIMTVFAATNEIPDILTTLRQELYEERTSLRSLRRHQRARSAGQGGGRHARDVFAGPELDEVVIRTLQNTVRHLFRRFKRIERPFLSGEEMDRRSGGDGRSGQRRRSGRRGSFDDDDPYTYYTNGGRSEWGNEKSGERSYQEEEDYARGIYCHMTLRKRLAWLRYRGEAIHLLEAVARLQTRRTARQVGEIAVILHEYSGTLEEMRHALTLTENRLNNVVGVRRVD